MSALHPQPSTVLVVEDDANLRLTLVDNLKDEGYSVVAASTVAEARAQWRSLQPDVVVLDLMLPDGDGYSLCREMRRASTTSRVLMLTARSLEDDVVRGFDEGADDYVAKPYRLRELLARIASLARRGSSTGASTKALTFGGFRVELESRQVLDTQKRAIELTRTEFDLLVYFVSRPGKALTRDEILDAVWGSDVVVDAHTVDNFVSSLRRKLGWRDGESGWEIKAVRGVGYRFETRAG